MRFKETNQLKPMRFTDFRGPHFMRTDDVLTAAALPRIAMRLCGTLIALVMGFGTDDARAKLLYGTDFEQFEAGDNRWVGTEGWQGNDTTSGAQGILKDFVGNLPLGKTAYLGYNPPSGAFTTVFRKIDHDPVASGMPVVTFDTLLGVQDSTLGVRDRFYISYYNMAGDFQAALCFDNTDGRIYREDADERVFTGVDFIRGNQLLGFVSLQLLEIRVDLAANRWSASIDGIPLFDGVNFAASGGTQDLGAIAAEWEIAKTSPALTPGNNWLFVADWYVRGVPQGVEPFAIDSFSRDGDGNASLVWRGQPGFDYRVEHSDNLATWLDDLPGSLFPEIAQDAPLEFRDEGAPPGRRFYRVVRSSTP